MSGRIARLILEVLVGLIAALFIVAGVLVWRLTQGPVEVNFLNPHIERALGGGEGGVEVKVASTVLAWEGWPETFVLHVGDVRLRSEERSEIRLPMLDLKLSFSALVSGTVAATEIEAFGARLVLVRDSDGFDFGAAIQTDESSSAQDVSRLVPRLLDDLMASPTPDRPLSYLRTLRVVDAELVVEDRVRGLVWHAPDAAVELRATGQGLRAEADMRLRLGGRLVETDATLNFLRGEGAMSLSAGFEGLSPAVLAKEVPSLETLSGVNVPLDGTLDARIGLDGTVLSVKGRVVGRDGTIAWKEALPEPRPVRRLELEGSYDAAGRAVELNRIRVDFGDDSEPGPLVTGQARATQSAEASLLEAAFEVERLEVNRLEDYWPVGVGGNARPWVIENIRNGTARHAGIEVRVAFPGDLEVASAELRHLDGSIEYGGIDVHYLRPLPPVRDIHGTARFDADSLDLSVAGGKLRDFRLSDGKIDIVGLDTTDHRIRIDFAASGSLRQGLEVLAHPRLDLLETLGLEPDATSGSAKASVAFRFPLIEELTFDDVEVSAQGRLSDVAVEDFVLGEDAAHGEFELSLDKRAMKVAGPVELAGVRLELDWNEYFPRDNELRTLIRATIPRLGEAARTRLGFTGQPFLFGPLSADLEVRQFRNDEGKLVADLGLDRARLAIPALGWEKPPDEPGNARFQVALEKGTPMALDWFSLDAGGVGVERLSASGSGRFSDAGNEIEQIRLDHVELGRTSFTDLVAEQREQAWLLSLGGGVFDASGIVDELFAGKSRDEESVKQEPSGGSAIEIARANLQRVYLAENRYIENVSVSGRRNDDGRWLALDVKATAPARFARAAQADGSLPSPPPDASGRPFTLHFGPDREGVRELRVESEDTGMMLRALDIVDTIEGGQLNVTGKGRSPDPDSPLDARLDVRNFKVVNAPALARVLTIASFTGILNLLQGEGITFESLKGSAIYDEGTVKTDLVHAYGPALGITARGSVDLRANETDLQGVVVPAASTNRVLGNIPVLGQLLTGGEGEGLFAVRYTATGPVDEPKVAVNPLSALAPGFLRGLFGIGEGAGKAPSSDDWPQAFPGERSDPGRTRVKPGE